jgi:hypothetical protein
MAKKRIEGGTRVEALTEFQRRAVRRAVERERARRVAAYEVSFQEASRASLAVASVNALADGAHRALPRLAAEGDSWFDYPPFGVRWLRPGGVVSETAEQLGIPILNLAHAGDEARQMLGTQQRMRLARLFEEQALDGLLFSGGGNDIVGDQLAILLRPNEGQPPADAFYADRLDAALTLVLSAYRDLRAMRDALRPRCVLFVHAYDVGFPDGRDVCSIGPWLKPPLDVRGWTEPVAAREVLRRLLGQFRARLQAFCAEDTNGRTVLVETHGTLPTLDDWHNELHPSRAGFVRIATRFAAAIRASLLHE